MSIFIVLEGGEGCGKSTQARILYGRLLQEGHMSLLVNEPGGTALGNQIRHILKSQHGEGQKRRQSTIAPVAELLLFSAARTQLVKDILRPALADGRTVVCDRYTPSTIAYQGYGRNIPLDTIDHANRLATGNLEPDLIVLLDMAPENSLRRVAAQTHMVFDSTTSESSGLREDEEGSRRFEEEPLSFHERVRAAYLDLAKVDQGHWLVVDAGLPIEQIAEAIWQRVAHTLQSKGS